MPNTNRRSRFFCAAIPLLAMAWLWVAGPVVNQVFALKVVAPPPRFPFKIDPKTPLQELLPVPPSQQKVMPPWLVQDLADLPEVAFEKLREAAKAGPDKKSEGFDSLTETMKQTAHTLAKMNHLNQKGTDHFLKTLLQKRADLAGLPFVMGDACRMSKTVGARFFAEVNHVVESKEQASAQSRGNAPDFWRTYEAGDRARPQAMMINHQARAAALLQMLEPDDADMRLGLIKHLSGFGVEHGAASRGLARLAIFSAEEKVREPALQALRKRPTKDYSELLSQGMRHPWPAIAQRTADAIVKLDRKDLVPDLVALLDQPDPRAPRKTTIQGRETTAVREVVRINHLRNCMLCHPPANTPDVKMDDFGRISGIASGAVPSPGHELSRSFGYRGSSPDIIVRADITYLRQDFSVMQKVENAKPWPEMQRLDFLVRTREVTEKDVQAYKNWVEQQGPGYLSPNHQAALSALRRLTGKDAGPTAVAWRKALGL